ncbi:CYTH domain-containing protein [Sutcliffiella horikoshii]|uniref:CYTH domain-containing protein n=1 Tax=Sutcliffiella horikoshii TaxID=79883 RepID=UPI00203E1EFC|nr:CYTH domain-containing protein [Sutcliffiella horikoshii]MCM3616844.1 CYTH domain-containing protein [Sutcliffiella horikoshii]
MSHQEIEIEFKNMLTFDEFTSLCSAFKVKSEDFFSQENHYFDTPTFALKDKGCALRVRKKGESFTLTLKQPAAEGLLETHQSVSEEEFVSMKEGHIGIIEGTISSILMAELGVDPSKTLYFGSLKTNRVELPYKNGLLVLDESNYMETSDFEVEFEVNNYAEGEKSFHELLTSYGIPLRETKNKIVRFYEAKAYTLTTEGDSK